MHQLNKYCGDSKGNVLKLERLMTCQKTDCTSENALEERGNMQQKSKLLYYLLDSTDVR
jgi:hypothetical protein